MYINEWMMMITHNVHVRYKIIFSFITLQFNFSDTPCYEFPILAINPRNMKSNWFSHPDLEYLLTITSVIALRGITFAFVPIIQKYNVKAVNCHSFIYFPWTFTEWELDFISNQLKLIEKSKHNILATCTYILIEKCINVFQSKISEMNINNFSPTQINAQMIHGVKIKCSWIHTSYHSNQPYHVNIF